MYEAANFQLGGPEKLTRADDSQHALQKNGGPADLWYMDDGDTMCHPILVPSYLHEFDAKVGAERKRQKTKVIYYVNDLDVAPLEWRIHQVQNMAKSPQSPLEASHSESLSDLDSTSRTNSWAKQTSFAQCTNAFSCARTRRQNLLSARVLGVSRSTSCECAATQSFRNSALRRSSTKLGSVLSNASSWSQRTVRCKPHSAQASPELDTRERETSRLQHTWEHSLQPSRASRR